MVGSNPILPSEVSQTVNESLPQQPCSRPRMFLIAATDDENNRMGKLFESYSKAGFDVVFVGMDRFSRRPKLHFTSQGMRCEYIMSGAGYANWRLLIAYPIWQIRLLWYALQMKADVVHSFELETTLPVALGCSLRGIPYFYDAQDNYEDRKSVV